MNFKIGSTAILSSALTIGQWYYFAAVYDGSHLNLYIGPTPETAAVAATPVAYSTATGNSTTGGIGATINGADFNGYLCRVSFSNVARTSFPTLVGSSGALGTYEFSTPPLAVTATKSYVVVLDSGTYNEAIYFNYRYDLTAALGIYSVDGQAPTITYAKGALAGTYGVGNSAQPALSAPNYYVSKSGSDSTGTGSSGNPWLTITHSIASMSSAQILQVMDSGVYQEDLVIPAGWAITIQAASGQAPTLRNVNQSASGVHLSSGSNLVRNLCHGHRLHLGRAGESWSPLRVGHVQFLDLPGLFGDELRELDGQHPNDFHGGQDRIHSLQFRSPRIFGVF